MSINPITLISIIAILVSLATIWKILQDPGRRLNNAISDKDATAVRELLEQGIDPDTCPPGQATPLYLACLEGSDEIVKLLLKYGADVNAGYSQEHGMNPLLAAAIGKYDVIEKTLLENGARTGMHYAALKGDIEQIKDRLKSPISINSMRNRGLSPLHLACLAGQKEMVEFLVAEGADINLCSPAGESPLHKAVESKNTEIIALLASLEADMNAVGRRGTPLHLAIWSDDGEIAEMLIQLGANVNFQKSSHDTPLRLAACKNRIEIVKMLIQYEADVNLAAPFDGKIPLHDAARNGNIEVVRILIENKSLLDHQGFLGITPLEEAGSYPEIASLLIRHGARNFGLSNE